MLTKEFLKYLESFNKKPGSYTEDEMYEIGLKHKDQLNVDKDWKELAFRVCPSKSGEAYRSFVNHKLKKEGKLPKNVRELNSRTIEDIKEKDVSENLDAQLEKLYKEKTKIRDTYNSYRRNLRTDARTEDFKDELIKAIDNLPEIDLGPYAVDYSNRKSKVEAVLMLSDLHLGNCCNNFYNHYNTQIAIKRVAKLAKDVRHYCEKQNVWKLNIVNLGDMIHGLIHTTARIEEELDIVQQITVASEILAKFLAEINPAAPVITYRSCTDNHSRAMANFKENIESENFSKLIDWYLKERLSGSKIQFCEDNIDDSIGKFELLNGKKVVFAHGHLDSTNKSLQHFMGATEEFIHYVLLAHEHSEKLKCYQNGKVITNGSIVGVDSYAMKLRLFNKPSQTLLVFDRDNLLNISIDLSVNE